MVENTEIKETPVEIKKEVVEVPVEVKKDESLELLQNEVSSLKKTIEEMNKKSVLKATIETFPQEGIKKMEEKLSIERMLSLKYGGQ